MGTTNRVDNLSNKTTTTPTGKDRSGTLLPNKQETWDYYHERNGESCVCSFRPAIFFNFGLIFRA